jgi:predicted DNA-binding ribbon-helix-helix protein
MKKPQDFGNRRSFYCDHELYYSLERIAKKESRSVSNLIRMILNRHLAARKREAKKKRGN